MKMNSSLSTAVAIFLSLACGSAARAESAGGAREAGPEDGFSCCSGASTVLFDGDEALTTTGRAGIFRSEDRGERWQRSMKGMVAANGVSPFVDFLCQAPSQPRTAYALAGLGGAVTPFNGLFASDDFGKTWTPRAALGTAFGLAFCAVDAADPRTIYVGTADANFVSQLWKSTDGGRTLHRIGADIPASFGAPFVFAVRGTVYVDIGDVFASTDGGSSFHRVPDPPGVPSGSNGGFAVSPDGHAIFRTTVDGSLHPTGTFRSTDGGASFAEVTGLPNGVAVAAVAFDPTDPSRIYVSDGLLRASTDGGLTFALLPASDDPRFLGPSPVHEISADPRGSIFLNTLGGLFRTDDGGQTFRSVVHGFRASAVQDLAFDADGKLLVGVLHTQVVFRQAQGHTFDPIGNAPLIEIDGFDNDGVSVAGSPIDPSVVLVATDGQGLLRTENGGVSWTRAEVEGHPTGYTNARVAFATASRVYLVAPNPTPPGLYRSDDEGRTFARLAGLPFGAIAVDPTNPDVFYVGTFGSPAGLFKSIDGGQTLQFLGQAGGFSALAVDRRNPQVVYAGQRFGQVIRSLDGGQTFASASAGLAGAGVHGLAQDARGTLFVWLRGGGLFSSDDGASSWHAVDTGEALRRSGAEAGRGALVADPRHPGRVYLGNAGVIEIDAGDDAGDLDD